MEILQIFAVVIGGIIFLGVIVGLSSDSTGGGSHYSSDDKKSSDISHEHGQPDHSSFSNGPNHGSGHGI